MSTPERPDGDDSWSAWVAAMRGLARQPPMPGPTTKAHDNHSHVFGTLYGCDGCEERCFCPQGRDHFGDDFECIFCERNGGEARADRDPGQGAGGNGVSVHLEER